MRASNLYHIDVYHMRSSNLYQTHFLNDPLTHVDLLFDWCPMLTSNLYQAMCQCSSCTHSFVLSNLINMLSPSKLSRVESYNLILII